MMKSSLNMWRRGWRRSRSRSMQVLMLLLLLLEAMLLVATFCVKAEHATNLDMEEEQSKDGVYHVPQHHLGLGYHGTTLAAMKSPPRPSPRPPRPSPQLPPSTLSSLCIKHHHRNPRHIELRDLVTLVHLAKHQVKFDEAQTRHVKLHSMKQSYNVDQR